MRVALAQISSAVGDFSNNAQKIIEYTHRAVEKRCDIVVFPELALFGYWPSDLLERASTVELQLKTLKSLIKKLPSNITVVFGYVDKNPNTSGRHFMNAAAVVRNQKIIKTAYKELLPTYDIFDEYRHFEFGNVQDNVVKIGNKKILITICEDIWGWKEVVSGAKYPKNPLLKLKKEKFDLVINLSASPFSINKQDKRKIVVKKTAELFKAPVVYVNRVGAQDEIIFDGRSMAVDKKAKSITECIGFEEDLNVFDITEGVGGTRPQTETTTETLRKALVVGIREFVENNGFKNVHFGLSGGVDSALVACLAVDAIGPGRVSAFALPSRFNAEESLVLAKQLANNLGIRFYELPIQPAVDVVIDSFKQAVGNFDFGLVDENVQARLRGLYLMAFSNFKGSLLLTTGNKSEYATGYSTLYGDMCGGLAPIADLLKRDVYALSRHYNSSRELIPNRILERAPSAELRPNQKDQDTLPEYDVLDSIVEKLVVKFGAAKTTTEKWVLERMYSSEFKRWQAPPILRVTEHAFGRGRRFPITNKARI